MKVEMLLAKGIKIEKSIFDDEGAVKLQFGGMLDFVVPDGCGLIILCGNSGGGFKPFWCGLPHQVYVDDLRNHFLESDYEVIYAIPVRSDESIMLGYRNEYGQNRWQEDKKTNV